jgi:hypothetical protein
MDLDNDVISKLKFIGKIQKGDKINVKNMNVQSDGLMTRITRGFIYFDNRQNTLTFIHNTVKKSFEILNHHLNSKHTFDKIIFENMVKDLKDSVKGMENLKETYMNDIMFCCKLDTLIEEIKARLTEMNKLDNKVIHEEKIEEKKEETKKDEVKKEKNK